MIAPSDLDHAVDTCDIPSLVALLADVLSGFREKRMEIDDDPSVDAIIRFMRERDEDSLRAMFLLNAPLIPTSLALSRRGR